MWSGIWYVVCCRPTPSVWLRENVMLQSMVWFEMSCYNAWVVWIDNGRRWAKARVSVVLTNEFQNASKLEVLFVCTYTEVKSLFINGTSCLLVPYCMTRRSGITIIVLWPEGADCGLISRALADVRASLGWGAVDNWFTGLPLEAEEVEDCWLVVFHWDHGSAPTWLSMGW